MVKSAASLKDFQEWLDSKGMYKVNVKVMDNNAVVAELNDGQVWMSLDINSNGYPEEMSVHDSENRCSVNIGYWYINQIIKVGDFWHVFVDGYNSFMFC